MPTTHRTVYFENAAGRVSTEPAGYLRLDYHPGRRDADAFHALLTHLRHAMSRHGRGRVLIDQRHMSGFDADEERWMVEHWLPLAVRENEYRAGAILTANDVFARLATSSLVLTSSSLGHQYRSFGDEQEAVAWLLTQ